MGAVATRPGPYLISRRKDGTVEVSANGRPDWVGWFELVSQAVNEVATQNTAAVIRDVDADVLAVIEVEDRPALERFNLDVLRLDPEEDWQESLAHGYRHVMLTDGNDDRGIDVGLMTRDDFPILQMRSHVDDGPLEWPTFSRDCVEHELHIPGGRLLLMINHFKSKRGGGRKAREAGQARAARIERAALSGSI